MPSTHARYSPSSFPYRERCAAWESKPGTNAAAEEGELLHAVMEGTEAEVNLLRSDLQPLAKAALDAMTKYLVDVKRIYKEERVDIDMARGHTTYGTSDVFVEHNSGKGTLIDYKFGRVQVPHPSANLQLRAYALGWFQKVSVSEITAVIIQPKCKPVVSSTIYTREDACRTYEELGEMMDRVVAQDPVRTPGDWCRYCEKQLKCHALQRVAAAEARKGPEMMTPEELAAALPIAIAAEAWAREVKNNARAALTAKVDVPGWTLKQAKGQRKITGSTTQCASMAGWWAGPLADASTPDLKKLPALARKGLIPKDWFEQLVKAKLAVQSDPTMTLHPKQKTKKHK